MAHKSLIFQTRGNRNCFMQAGNQGKCKENVGRSGNEKKTVSVRLEKLSREKEEKE